MTTSELLPFLFSPDGAPSSLVTGGFAVTCLGRPVRGVRTDPEGVVLDLASPSEDEGIDARTLAAALEDGEGDRRLFAEDPDDSVARAVPADRGIRMHTDHRGRPTLEIGVAVPVTRH